MKSKYRLSELEEMIAVSIYVMPCTTLQLKERDFLKTISYHGVEESLHYLDIKCEAIIFLGDSSLPLQDMKMKIKKSFMRKSGLLDKYELE